MTEELFSRLNKYNLSLKDLQITDVKTIEEFVVLTDNPEKTAEYKSGKDKLFGFFVGRIMKLTEGKANPDLVNEVLKKLLSE